MNIIEKAYAELFPEKPLQRTTKIKYSGKFSGYNANVRYTPTLLEFRLSRSWKEVSEEIKIGLLQSLMAKIFKTNVKTNAMDMYTYFLKSLHVTIPKTETDPLLETSFNRVNEKYVNGMIEKPNLVWGAYAKRKLGSYTYATDTILMSSILKDGPQHFLDYVMYHELLHKKHKFEEHGRRSHHHTPAFKADEGRFDNQEEVEKQLNYFLAKKRVKRWFGF